MDWLSTCHPKLDCFQKMGTFLISENHSVKSFGIKKQSSSHIISAIRANRLLGQGCEGFLAYVFGGSEVKKELTEVSVVCDYLDVFPDDLLGLPLDGEVEFSTDIVPETVPISKTPYQSLKHLIEWHRQSQRNLLNSCKSYWIKVLSEQVHHLGVHQSFLLRRKTDLYGCVLIIDNSIR